METYDHSINIKLIFKVYNKNTYWGQNIFVTGDKSYLGNWHPNLSLQVYTGGDTFPLWETNPIQFETSTDINFDYKYLIKLDQTTYYEWENFKGNRHVSISMTKFLNIKSSTLLIILTDSAYSFNSMPNVEIFEVENTRKRSMEINPKIRSSEKLPHLKGYSSSSRNASGQLSVTPSTEHHHLEKKFEEDDKDFSSSKNLSTSRGGEDVQSDSNNHKTTVPTLHHKDSKNKKEKKYSHINQEKTNSPREKYSTPLIDNTRNSLTNIEHELEAERMRKTSSVRDSYAGLRPFENSDNKDSAQELNQNITSAEEDETMRFNSSNVEEHIIAMKMKGSVTKLETRGVLDGNVKAVETVETVAVEPSKTPNLNQEHQPTSINNPFDRAMANEVGVNERSELENNSTTDAENKNEKAAKHKQEEDNSKLSLSNANVSKPEVEHTSETMKNETLENNLTHDEVTSLQSKVELSNQTNRQDSEEAASANDITVPISLTNICTTFEPSLVKDLVKEKTFTLEEKEEIMNKINDPMELEKFIRKENLKNEIKEKIIAEERIITYENIVAEMKVNWKKRTIVKLPMKESFSENGNAWIITKEIRKKLKIEKYLLKCQAVFKLLFLNREKEREQERKLNRKKSLKDTPHKEDADTEEEEN